MGLWYKPHSKPEDFKWKEHGTLLDHLQFFIDVREYIAHSDPPDGYCQMSHSDASTVRNPENPAVLDASYKHFHRPLISISIPSFVPSCSPMRGQGSEEGINTEFTYWNYSASMLEIFRRFGIEKTAPEKIGMDRYSQTVYFEFNVDEDDYDKGRRIIDTYIRGRKTDAAALFRQIRKDLIKHGFDAPDTPPEARGLTHMFITNAGDGLRRLGKKCGVFSSAAREGTLDTQLSDPKLVQVDTSADNDIVAPT